MLAVCVLPACTKDKAGPMAGTTANNEAAQNVTTAVAPAPQLQTGALKINILPAAPTVLTDLQAVYSGDGAVAYQWSRNGQAVPGATNFRFLKDQFQKGDTVSVTVNAGNQEGTVSVVIGNSPPRVLSAPFVPDTPYAGGDLRVNPVGFDADGDQVGFHYKWSVNGKELPPDSPVLTRDNFKKGDTLTLTIIPFDKDGPGEPFVSNKDMPVPNTAPKITSNPPQDFQGNVYTYQVTATDPDNDPLSFSLAAAPVGMVIDTRTGVITWPVNGTSLGAHAVEVVAQDTGGMKATQRYTLTIVLPEGGAK